MSTKYYDIQLLHVPRDKLQTVVIIVRAIDHVEGHGYSGEGVRDTLLKLFER